MSEKPKKTDSLLLCHILALAFQVNSSWKCFYVKSILMWHDCKTVKDQTIWVPELTAFFLWHGSSEANLSLEWATKDIFMVDLIKYKVCLNLNPQKSNCGYTLTFPIYRHAYLEEFFSLCLLTWQVIIYVYIIFPLHPQGKK